MVPDFASLGNLQSAPAMRHCAAGGLTPEDEAEIACASALASVTRLHLDYNLFFGRNISLFGLASNITTAESGERKRFNCRGAATT